ncbi:MAG: HNH endonuclease [Sandaracinaceae bacterium]
MDDGSRISVETFRRIACDCSLIGVKHDADGDPLDVGRKTRTIPPALWRAIVLRDRGCAFPGCTNERFLDGHHIEHWAQGGETNKRNLVCLCTFHHQLVHEGGFRVRTDEQGRAAFFDRTGNEMRANGWTPPSVTPLELLKPIQDRQVELAIDDETAYPMWDGSIPDYDLCVCAVLGVERRARQAESVAVPGSWTGSPHGDAG